MEKNDSILFILQFGADKDVFAARFARNSHITFHHLYKCGEEEKSKVTPIQGDQSGVLKVLLTLKQRLHFSISSFYRRNF